MPLTQIEKVLIKVMYCFAAGIVMLQVLGVGAAVSGLFSFTFFLVALLWISAARRQITTNDLLAMGVIFLAVVHVFLNAWSNDASLSFSYLKKVIMFSTSVLYIVTVSKLRVDRELAEFLSKVNVVLVLYLIGFFFLQNRSMHLLNGYVSRYLTFRFTNPNLAGLFLTCIALHEGTRIQRANQRKEKVILLGMFAVLCYFIVLTESRSALLATAFFVFLGVFFAFRGNTIRKMPDWLLAVVAIFPLAFAIIYLSFANSSWLNQTFSFLVNEGKALTNRVEIWQRAFRAFAQSPILGAYSQLSNKTGNFQMHNTHVDILSSYGISVLIGVCVLLYRSMALKNTVITSQVSSLSLIAFIGSLMLGIGEAALFSGGIGIYLFVCEFLLLANPLSEESDNEARFSE